MVALGYGVYLLYSILVAPVMIGLAAKVFGGLQRPVAATVAAFGALSALARAIDALPAGHPYAAQMTLCAQ